MGCKYVPEELKKAARKELGAASEKDIVQSDFTQNDATALSHIKNRPFYTVDITERCVDYAMREPIDLIQEQVGSIFRLSGPVRYIPFIEYLGKDSIGKHVIMHYETRDRHHSVHPSWPTDVSMDIVLGGPGKRYGISQEPSKSYEYNCECSIIGGESIFWKSTMCKVWIYGVHAFTVYFIIVPSNLPEDYANKFTESGIYLEYVANSTIVSDYFRVSFVGIYDYVPIDACHLPTQVEYNYYKVSEITDDNKDSTEMYPSVAAVEKRLQLTSPDGSKWTLSVADDGILSATKIEA